jgi:type II secretory pathway component PulF
MGSSMTQNDAVLQRLDALTAEVNTLTRGLIMVTEAMEDHSEMLAQILEACAVEPGESPLTEALEQIVASIDRQHEALISIGETLENIGPGIEEAVVRGVHRANGTVDADGVVQE